MANANSDTNYGLVVLKSIIHTHTVNTVAKKLEQF